MEKTKKNSAEFQDWQKRWQNAEDNEQITVLGKLMFKAKQKALTRVLAGIEVQTVLEVGCGLGYTLGYYQAMGFDCHGIDVVQESIDACVRKGLNARLEKIADVSEQYDLVSSDGMLEHFLNFEPYARQIMAASSRYVLLIQPNYSSLTGQTMGYLGAVLRGHVNVYEFNYRLNDFCDVFEANGFGIIQSIPIFTNVFRLLLFERRK